MTEERMDKIVLMILAAFGMVALVATVQLSAGGIELERDQWRCTRYAPVTAECVNYEKVGHEANRSQ
jgi:hypothetical protein